MDIDPIKFGINLQKVETMEAEMAEIKKDVKELLALANKSRGGFWMGMVIASGVGGLITYFTSWLHPK
ncbi:hypothetical protein UFOVP11_9 [uncultured Caudovirales phage]|uniref:Uncharacterized protein n=1 Tax=uncultured Caudovirales phage TaxID=2100421 RepID=A0A6J5KJ77_9CAUD|nr:hypothetical protein UFOVP11_9 [uncultured Caudovirales phage]